MRLLLISDIHGRVDIIQKLLTVIDKPDLVVIAGDITNFGGYNEAAGVIEPILMRNIPVFAVAGNCDTEGVEDYLVDKKMSLHERAIRHGDFLFIGASGSLPCPGMTPMEHGDGFFFTTLSRAINHTHSKPAPGENKNLVVVTHQPAFGTFVDDVGGRHTGSRSIRRFIENQKPLLALSGHIHEAMGQDTLGSSILVNPGPLKQNNYAEIEIEASEVKIRFSTL